MAILIEKVDHENEQVQRQILEFLAPHEIYSLFIIGNLKSSFPGSHIYTASRDGKLVGVAGYYEKPKSLIPFSADDEATGLLMRTVAENHTDMEYLNAISHVAEPAYAELSRHGYKLTGNPREVFLSLDGEPSPQPYEDCAHPMTEADYKSVAKLFRYLRNQPQEPEVTQEEIDNLNKKNIRYVLEIDGKVVSTAATNGPGISAFQIIGVATHLECRNKGYAKSVCAALIRAMYKKEGLCKAVLFTDMDNIAARQCYKRLGFKEAGEYWLCCLSKS